MKKQKKVSKTINITTELKELFDSWKVEYNYKTNEGLLNSLISSLDCSTLQKYKISKEEKLSFSITEEDFEYIEQLITETDYSFSQLVYNSIYQMNNTNFENLTGERTEFEIKQDDEEQLLKEMKASFHYDKVDYSGYYYNIQELFDNYPNAFFYLVIGGRNTGKTFSTEVNFIKNDLIFGYIRRTIDEIKMISTSTGRTGNGVLKSLNADLSPLKSVNNCIGSNIRLFPLTTGISGFFHCTEDLTPISKPCGYAIALNATSKVRGFDLSDIDIILYDECCSYFSFEEAFDEEITIFELFKTITRDAVHKNKKVPFVGLSNASNLNAPIIKAFDIQNDIIELVNTAPDANGKKIKVIDRKGAKIVIELLQPNPLFIEAEQNSDLYKITEGTKWNKYAYGNDFAFNDISKVMHKKQFKEFIETNLPVHRAERLAYIQHQNKRFCLTSFEGVVDSDVNIYAYLYEDAKPLAEDVKVFYFDEETERKLFFETFNRFIAEATESKQLFYQTYDLYEEFYHRKYVRKGT